MLKCLLRTVEALEVKVEHLEAELAGLRSDGAGAAVDPGVAGAGECLEGTA